MTDDLITTLANQAGLTREEAKRVIRTIDNYRLEKGEKAYQDLLSGVYQIVDTAKTDGVPLSVLIDAIQRRKS